jgi:hypothetical protein
MPASSAGKIERALAGLRMKKFHQPLNKVHSFGVITLIVKHVIIFAVEPAFKPTGFFSGISHWCKDKLRIKAEVISNHNQSRRDGLFVVKNITPDPKNRGGMAIS